MIIQWNIQKCIWNNWTRSTRPIDAKLWKKLCLWIIFNIKISLYQTPLYQRPNISDILKCFIDNTSKTFDMIDRIKLPAILGNWNFWIIWNLCDLIWSFQYSYWDIKILYLKYAITIILVFWYKYNDILIYR